LLDLGFHNMDCMEGMKQFPDKYFDLAIVDPPYFSGPEKREYYGKKKSSIGVQRLYKKSKCWMVPSIEYFEELKRVSKNQIIWGINYYPIFNLGSGRIIWDKVNGTSTFSDAEIAYCSMHNSTRLFSYMWNGMFQGKSISEGKVMQGDKSKNEIRIHPTQKPIALYTWLLNNYAKQGDKILDTHVGSASSLIACEKLRFQYVGFELDKDYYDTAVKRLKDTMAQKDLFDMI